MTGLYIMLLMLLQSSVSADSLLPLACCCRVSCSGALCVSAFMTCAAAELGPAVFLTAACCCCCCRR